MSEDLTGWIGNTAEMADIVTAWPTRALQATLDLDDPPVTTGDPLPPMWHWLYFLETVPGADLGEEGHARLGGFLPPVPLPRRMFAGGRTEFIAPLRIGDCAVRRSTVASVVEKRGKTGPLVFVTVRHEITAEDGEPRIVEEQDLVYRDQPTTPERPEPGAEPIPEAAWTETVSPNEVMLFRFSALTFNGHRIHYDHPYTTGVEGYPHLIVHGPLTALLLAHLAHRRGGRRLRAFSFRARSPLFLGGSITLTGDSTGDVTRLAAWSDDRRLAMTAEAVPAGAAPDAHGPDADGRDRA